MMTKTQWLDWVEASTDRLQERYRQAWNRLPRGQKREQPETDSKPWSMIQPEIDREEREVVVHLELPEPHTVEADVRVIGQTLAISVLRSGSGIKRAAAEDCYRRAIPLPPEVDPASAVHKVHGDELVIRLQPGKTERRAARTSAATRQRAVATARQRANGTARQRANGTPRLQANGTTRLQANGTKRQPVNGTTRQTASSTARQGANGTTRQSANGTARQTASGTTRQSANGTARQSANGTTRQSASGASRQRTSTRAAESRAVQAKRPKRARATA